MKFRRGWPVHIEDIPELSDQVLSTAEEVEEELRSNSVTASANFVEEFTNCTTMARAFIDRRQEVLGDRDDPPFWRELLRLQKFLQQEVIAKRASLREKTSALVGALVSSWYAQDVVRRIKSGMADGCERVEWQHPEDTCVYPPQSTAIHVLN